MKPARASPRPRPTSRPPPRPALVSPSSQKPPPLVAACGRAGAPARAAWDLRPASFPARVADAPTLSPTPPSPESRARPRPESPERPGLGYPTRLRPPAPRGSRGPPSSESPSQRWRGLCLPVQRVLTMPKPLTVWITINCGKF
ncbi:uncharacterized protein LOC133066720 [Dama dama]|uniref:uncharacterized protein LOC133066720 n=1 Tax=Dama dama TaxID=30532 RepID=UPI002A35D355|nr:uncharacterized protein LOC133066720 [Dama dama]